ncbi:nitrilase-related carbon-nitrogen hydrolase [Streptomyces thermocarboxydus]
MAYGRHRRSDQDRRLHRRLPRPVHRGGAASRPAHRRRFAPHEARRSPPQRGLPVHPEGTVHEHEKTHIFPGEAAWSTSEGDELKAIDLPFAKVGFAVCYEAEIPEVSSSLAEQGAEIILCPSYTFTEHGFWRVRHCAASRAIENQVYFVHCSTGGSPGAPLPNGWTRSSILGPCDQPWAANGVIAEAGRTPRPSHGASSTSTRCAATVRTAPRRRSVTAVAAPVRTPSGPPHQDRLTLTSSERNTPWDICSFPGQEDRRQPGHGLRRTVSVAGRLQQAQPVVHVTRRVRRRGRGAATA